MSERRRLDISIYDATNDDIVAAALKRIADEVAGFTAFPANAANTINDADGNVIGEYEWS